MNISFQYNWPPGNQYASVSLGMVTVEDPKFLFRVGLVKKEDKTKVYWQGPEEWMSSEQVSGVKFVAESGDLVVVDKKNKETEEIVMKHRWDTAVEWPPEAHGASSTHVPYDF